MVTEPVVLYAAEIEMGVSEKDIGDAVENVVSGIAQPRTQFPHCALRRMDGLQTS